MSCFFVLCRLFVLHCSFGENARAVAPDNQILVHLASNAPHRSFAAILRWLQLRGCLTTEVASRLRHGRHVGKVLPWIHWSA
ncbi:hypothetical protein EJB05_30863, partial [Eragrostis curvula]